MTLNLSNAVNRETLTSEQDKNKQLKIERKLSREVDDNRQMTPWMGMGG